MSRLVGIWLRLWHSNGCVPFIPIHWKWRKCITKLFFSVQTVLRICSCPCPNILISGRHLGLLALFQRKTAKRLSANQISSHLALDLWRRSRPILFFFFFFFFVNLVYRAEIEIYVTRTIRCLGLRTRRRVGRYCPRSCWDSGGWPPSVGLYERVCGFGHLL